jgi:N-acyl amino acid synthase of PEP-CTERM/exosortase system
MKNGPALPAGAAGFAPYFRSRQAHPGPDDALMAQVFGLRFQVYCVECGFLPAASYPSGRETDRFDAQSAHFCAFNGNDELVGYVRLVRAGAAQTLPFLDNCVLQAPPGVALLDFAQTAQTSAEISRLMVRHDYRRRRHDNLAGVTVQPGGASPTHEKRRDTPQILLSLYRQMYAYSHEHGIRHWYAAMEPALGRVLARMDFAFVQIGPLADYYGPVAPYRADVRELEARLGSRNPGLLAWLRAPEGL